MTYSEKGTGTRLCGKRKLKNEEIDMWLRDIRNPYYISFDDYYIATEAFSIFWLPIIPFETFVFYYSVGGDLFHQGPSEWIKVYYPNGINNVYWKHVITNILPEFIIVLVGLLIGNFFLQIF